MPRADHDRIVPCGLLDYRRHCQVSFGVADGSVSGRISPVLADVLGRNSTETQQAQSDAGMDLPARRDHLVSMKGVLGLVSAAAALGLASLGAILFLSADEAQSSPMLADDAGALDALLEPSKQLIERLGILDLNPHAKNHHLLSMISDKSAHVKSAALSGTQSVYDIRVAGRGTRRPLPSTFKPGSPPAVWDVAIGIEARVAGVAQEGVHPPQKGVHFAVLQ